MESFPSKKFARAPEIRGHGVGIISMRVSFCVFDSEFQPREDFQLTSVSFCAAGIVRAVLRCLGADTWAAVSIRGRSQCL